MKILFCALITISVACLGLPGSQCSLLETKSNYKVQEKARLRLSLWKTENDTRYFRTTVGLHAKKKVENVGYFVADIVVLILR